MKRSIVLIIALVGGVLTWNAHSSSSCTQIYIDYGVINDTKVTKCVDISIETNALNVLKSGGVELEGTAKYGNQIVCRVAGLPDVEPIGIKGHEQYIELCQTMPPEFAYWAVLVKRHQTFPNPFDVRGKWGWAQTGIDKVVLKPGDSIGLVFSDNGKVRFP